MIRIVTLLVVLLLSQLTNSQNKFEEEINTSIKVAIPNVSGNEGVVIVALYDSHENFMKRKVLTTKKGSIENGISKVVFENVAPGIYAIVCVHDKNENNRMDFDLNGMPLEDYGSSNNVMRMGPPDFESAKFTVENKSVDLTIRF